MTLTAFQRELCDSSPYDFTGLRALYVNCTLKHCSNVLYSLQHLGYMIPPEADAGCIGEAGPGPSYLDRLGWPGVRLHDSQHHVHDVEPPPPRAALEGRGRGAGPRQPALALGGRLPLRLREPGVPLASGGVLPAGGTPRSRDYAAAKYG